VFGSETYHFRLNNTKERSLRRSRSINVTVGTDKKLVFNIVFQLLLLNKFVNKRLIKYGVHTFALLVLTVTFANCTVGLG